MGCMNDFCGQLNLSHRWSHNQVTMRQAYDYRQDVEEYGSEIPTPPLGESVYAPLRLT